MKKLILPIISILFLNCSSDNGRYELYDNGRIKLDKKTGQIWIKGGEMPEAYEGYYKIETED